MRPEHGPTCTPSTVLQGNTAVSTVIPDVQTPHNGTNFVSLLHYPCERYLRAAVRWSPLGKSITAIALYPIERKGPYGFSLSTVEKTG